MTMSYDDAIELGTLRTRQTADDDHGTAAERRTRNMGRFAESALINNAWNSDETNPETWAGEPGPVE
jgi:hypothetical protein